jgi:hypothetical protein
MTVNVSKPVVNVREKLAELDKPTGIAGEAMLRAETPQEQFNLIGAGRRNILINGDFQVWQRGDYTTATNAGNNVYYTDRFKVRNSQGSSDMTIQHITNDHPPNVYHGDAVKCVSTTGASTIEHMGLYHIIEDYQKLQGQTVTYSAWVKANTAVQIWIYELGTTNRFSTSENHSGNGQWEKLTVTHTYLTNNSIGGAYTYITTYGNTTPANGYHISTQHQLELGKVATPFEHRSYGEELALCQRYYQVIKAASGSGYKRFARGHVVASNLLDCSINLPVEMRTYPTLVTTGTTSDYAIYHGNTVSACSTTPDLNTASDDGVGNVISLNAYVASGLTLGQGAALLSNNSYTSYLAFNAEL